MDSSRNKTSRTCPVCGAHNSGLSLFCSECGSGLNEAAWQDDGQTQAFLPAASSTEYPWQPTDAGSQSRSSATFQTNETATVGSPAAHPGSSESPSYGSGTMVSSWTTPGVENDRGSRGFALGILAWLLILTVFGAYLWSSVLSSGLRDDIRELIPGLSVILFRV